ncbi:MAG: aldehyde dehydrogenase family protein [Actinomycetota bacterium]|nr:aldehyde dehydrogenase family protein [Actinomycetota bacterium]
MERIVDRLVELGVRPADRVAVSMPNSVRTVLVLWAIIRLGCLLALVDHRQTTERRRSLANSAAAAWLFCDDESILSDEANNTFRVVRADHLLDSDADTFEETGHGTLLPAPSNTDPGQWYERSDALLIWSSGTTGVPKSIVRSGPSLRRNIARTQQRMRYRDTDVMLPLLPLSHQYGFSLLLLWQSIGCGFVACQPHRVDYSLQAIIKWRVTVFDATPPSYDALLRRIESQGLDVSKLDHVRMWCVGGAPLGSSLRSRFQRVIGLPLLDGYGSSELGNIALAAGPRCTGCGQPLDDVKVAVVDQNGDPVPIGQPGELVVESPDAMTGVLGPEGTILPVDLSVYRTQDLGSLDAQGNVTVFGRKHAVHRMGHTLYPEELAVRAEECGQPVWVVARDHVRLGAQLIFVVADESGRTASYWRERYSEVFAEYEQPNRVIVVDRLPTNSNGKVDATAVRAIVEQTLASRDCRLWAGERRPGDDRLSLVQGVADILKRSRADVRAILVEIAHHRAVEDEIDRALAALEGARDEISKYRPGQLPAAAVFMPSNMLLYGYVLYLVIPSLYVDRISFRASRKIEKATWALHDLVCSEVDVPWQLCDLTQRQFIEGPVAQSELVIMTGTYRNAERVRAALRPQQLFLYYGQGINPFIVGPDADIGKAVADVVRVRTFNSGQDCFGPDQILVHGAIADEFLDELCSTAKQLQYGENRDPRSDYGPLFYDDAFEASLEYLRRNADNIILGGEVSIPDRHLRPTVLDLPLDTSGVAPEMFAPIFNVVRYASTQKLHSVLSSSYFSERAMGAMLHGSMPDTAVLLRRRHMVCEDSTLLEHEDGNSPFGGYGIVANYIAHAGKRTAEPVLASKAVADYLDSDSWLS